MKIYVAGGFLEKDVISGYMRRLEEVGHVITCDWTRSESSNPNHAGDKDLSEAEALRFANADLNGVREADHVWHIVAGYKGSRGAYVETGAAIALGKAIIVSGDWRASIFHHLAHWKFDDHESAFQAIAKFNPKSGSIPLADRKVLAYVSMTRGPGLLPAALGLEHEVVQSAMVGLPVDNEVHRKVSSWIREHVE